MVLERDQLVRIISTDHERLEDSNFCPRQKAQHHRMTQRDAYSLILRTDACGIEVHPLKVLRFCAIKIEVRFTHSDDEWRQSNQSIKSRS